MTMLTGQSCLWIIFCLQRCLSIVVAVVHLCDPAATRPRTGKSAGSPSFEELPRTSHHRARYRPLYR
jgi:hypothetical protein